ncbi:hypothetical protein B0O99DRAFT_528925 [Bisporella sp. PMI_857]|nr:hypothetical protein B0O99DRAFT_528925 [Bisporella sp. PMI_857]
MSHIPDPQYPLEDACSTIYQNTLYSYSPHAFQSLDLEEGAIWVDIGGGVPVTGGVCVNSIPKNNTAAAALYIVGGTANLTDYDGLQRYTFSTGKWETIRPTDPVTQNRLYHGAVYINSTDSILVYAGNQDGRKELSSQTFTIQASEPYRVLAYESIAPPAVSPLLMPWSEREVLYIGGSDTNMKAMLFNPSTAWVDSNVTLAEPIYKADVIKSILIDGDDASKMLYTFDMSVAPNQVNRTVLVNGDGTPVSDAKPIFVKGGSRKREEEGSILRTAANWPAYNATLAPSSTRTAYSVAEDETGLVVISGGNKDDVLCMFTARDNCWLNATSKLVSKSSTQQGLGIDSTPTSSDRNSSETTAAAASTSSVAVGGSSVGIKTPIKVLIAVLVSVVGVAFILMAVLFFLRWRRKRRQHHDVGHQRRASGIPPEKDDMEFTGLPNMSTARQFKNHETQPSAGSFSSMAILMGRGQRRGDRASLNSSSSSQFNKKYKNAISNPIPQDTTQSHFGTTAQTRQTEKPLADAPAAVPRPRGNTGGRRGSTRRSSGWNRYWSGGSALNILGFGSKRATIGSDAETTSQYSEHRPSHVTQHSIITQQSAMVPPLRLPGPPELNRVASGSPTVANTSSSYPLTREMSGQIDRASIISDSSYDDDDRRDAFSSGVPASVQEHNSWNPVDRDRHDWNSDRGHSNAYTESVYTTAFPRTTVATFPRDTRFPPPPPPPVPMSDMSWLNLGGDSRV